MRIPAAVLIVLMCATGGCSEAEADLGSGAFAPSAPSPPPGHAYVIFGADTVTAELAETPAAHSRGLMNRAQLEEGTGMLFVFEDEATRSFWMRNTLIALDISFLDRTFRIVDIQQMEPLSETMHESARPAMFALEVPRGYHEARGIRVGDQAQLVFGRR